MKTKTLLFFLLFATACVAQVPDTLYTVHQGGEVYVVTVTTLPDGQQVTRRSSAMDSLTAARRMYQLIYDNELGQVTGVRQIKENDALSALYTDANSELTRLTGQGYIGQARRFLSENFVGYWIASLGANSTRIELQEGGAAVEVDAQGNAVQGGFSGTWRPITEHSWQLVAFFPTNILPAGERIVSSTNGSKFFITLNTNLLFEKE